MIVSTTFINSVRAVKGAALFCSALALLLLSIGTATPSWIRNQGNQSRVGVSVLSTSSAGPIGRKI